MKTIVRKLGKKKLIALSVSLAAILIVAGILLFVNFSKGKITSEEWYSIGPGTSKETVVEYLGEPKEKAISYEKIHASLALFSFAATNAKAKTEMNKDFEDSRTPVNDMIDFSNLVDDGLVVELYEYECEGVTKSIYFFKDKIYVLF